MSDGPSIRNHRITKADFRPCSPHRARSQAPFYLYARSPIADRAEGTFALLRSGLVTSTRVEGPGISAGLCTSPYSTDSIIIHLGSSVVDVRRIVSEDSRIELLVFPADRPRPSRCHRLAPVAWDTRMFQHIAELLAPPSRAGRATLNVTF